MASCLDYFFLFSGGRESQKPSVCLSLRSLQSLTPLQKKLPGLWQPAAAQIINCHVVPYGSIDRGHPYSLQ